MPRRSSATATPTPTTPELDDQGLEELPDFTMPSQNGHRPDTCDTLSPWGTKCTLEVHSGSHSWQGEQPPADDTGDTQQPALPGTPEPEKTDYDVPAESTFAGKDFVSAPGLKAIATRLIADKDALSVIRGLEVRYLWKRRGGTSGGNPKLGALQRPGGLLRYFTGGTPFVCWLAADNCRDLALKPEQIEAAMFHQLLHADTNPDDEDQFRIRGHSFEGFVEELDEFGPWSADLREVAAHMHSLPLDQALADADADDGQESN